MVGTAPGGQRRSVEADAAVSAGWGMGSIEVKSYRYLRMAMVGLLVGLAVAVAYQTVLQGSFLSSISAYYYTPAQAIFVGGLVAVGVCMIALDGTHPVEDVFLNLGGMLAPVVAIVPTARSEDFRTAVRACRQTDTSMLTAPTDVDCPTVQALAEATRANVENNMVALLCVGGTMALLASLLYLFRGLRHRQRGGRTALGKKFWWGLGAATGVYVWVAHTFLTSTEWFIDRAHYIAAVGLFVCIVVVVVANALRRGGERRGNDENTREGAGTGVPARRLDRYASLALIMVAAVLVGIVLVLIGVVTVFWLETAVIALFAVFWFVQTLERWDHSQPALPIETAAARAT